MADAAARSLQYEYKAVSCTVFRLFCVRFRNCATWASRYNWGLVILYVIFTKCIEKYSKNSHDYASTNRRQSNKYCLTNYRVTIKVSNLTGKDLTSYMAWGKMQ